MNSERAARNEWASRQRPQRKATPYVSYEQLKRREEANRLLAWNGLIIVIACILTALAIVFE